MLDSTKSNPNCSFTQDVVSYLYDEMSGGEKLKFEQHLRGCLRCGEELGAFSTVSNSIQNWRDIEFSGAPTPEISRSLYDPTNTLVEVDQNNGGSWLSNLRQLFDLSPAWLKTAAAFGTLAIIIGLGWFMFGETIKQNNEIAKTPEQNSNPIAQKESIALNETEQVSDNEVNKPEIAELKEGTPIEGSTEADISPNEPVRRSPEKTIRNDRRSSRSKGRTNNNSQTAAKKTKRDDVAAPVFKKAPRLTDEVAIDDSDELRLSDIFSEIGS